MAAKGKKAAKGAKGGARQARPKPRGLYTFLSWFLAPLLYVVFFPTAIILTVGMVPTIVCYLIIDRTRQKFATKTVGWLNLGGVFAVSMTMWHGDHSTEKVMELLGEAYNWVLMYGAAGVGWMLYFGVRPIVAAYLSVKAEAKRKKLRARQRELIREWGDTVRQGAQEWESEHARKDADDDEQEEDEEASGDGPQDEAPAAGTPDKPSSMPGGAAAAG